MLGARTERHQFERGIIHEHTYWRKRGPGCGDGAAAGGSARAKYIAETYLTEVEQYNEVRGMLGYTGLYKGKRVSVQGSGMGLPSISIYAQELIRSYGVKNLIRVGTCGAMQDHVRVRDVILAQGACTDSSMNRNLFLGYDYAPIADFHLLKSAYEQATGAGMNVHVGNIYSTDVFYKEDTSAVQRLMDHGVLGVEMESYSALYDRSSSWSPRPDDSYRKRSSADRRGNDSCRAPEHLQRDDDRCSGYSFGDSGLNTEHDLTFKSLVKVVK